MEQIRDLLAVFHQIDTLRGKVCATCMHWQRRGADCRGEAVGLCRKGYDPYGHDDGCDDWKPQKPITPIVSKRVLK